MYNRHRISSSSSYSMTPPTKNRITFRDFVSCAINSNRFLLCAVLLYAFVTYYRLIQTDGTLFVDELICNITPPHIPLLLYFILFLFVSISSYARYSSARRDAESLSHLLSPRLLPTSRIIHSLSFFQADLALPFLPPSVCFNLLTSLCLCCNLQCVPHTI